MGRYWPALLFSLVILAVGSGACANGLPVTSERGSGITLRPEGDTPVTIEWERVNIEFTQFVTPLGERKLAVYTRVCYGLKHLSAAEQSISVLYPLLGYHYHLPKPEVDFNGEPVPFQLIALAPDPSRAAFSHLLFEFVIEPTSSPLLTLSLAEYPGYDRSHYPTLYSYPFDFTNARYWAGIGPLTVSVVAPPEYEGIVTLGAEPLGELQDGETLTLTWDTIPLDVLEVECWKRRAKPSPMVVAAVSTAAVAVLAGTIWLLNAYGGFHHSRRS